HMIPPPTLPPPRSRPPPTPTLLPYTTLFRSTTRCRGGIGSAQGPSELGQGGVHHLGSHLCALALQLQPVAGGPCATAGQTQPDGDRKSTRLNSSHVSISYAVFCLEKKTDTGK